MYREPALASVKLRVSQAEARRDCQLHVLLQLLEVLIFITVCPGTVIAPASSSFFLSPHGVPRWYLQMVKLLCET